MNTPMNRGETTVLREIYTNANTDRASNSNKSSRRTSTALPSPPTSPPCAAHEFKRVATFKRPPRSCFATTERGVRLAEQFARTRASRNARAMLARGGSDEMLRIVEVAEMKRSEMSKEREARALYSREELTREAEYDMDEIRQAVQLEDELRVMQEIERELEAYVTALEIEGSAVEQPQVSASEKDSEGDMMMEF